MKTKLFYSLAVVLFGSALVQAQQLIHDDFNSYAQGDLAMDLTGVNGGQGNWKIFANIDGKLSDFQIVDIVDKGNVLFLTSPDLPSNNQYNNAKYAWKDLPVNGWQQRTTGNDILRVEYEFFTGNSPVSSSVHRNITYAADGTLIAGFQYDPGTKRLRGMTRLNIQGTPQIQFILLAGPQADLFLPADTWVKVVYQIDYNTDEITFQIPMANIDGKISTVSLATHPPAEIDFVSYMSVTDFTPTRVMYDNYTVSAVPTTSLGVNEVVSNAFSLYPNPVADLVNIINKENIAVDNIRVFDLNGRTVQTQKFNHQSDVQMNLSQLTPGIYLMYITTNEGTAVKKIIKK